MKSTFEKMGGTYTLGADGIYYPNLVSTDEEPHYGKYGMMRKTYLKEHRPAMYSLYILEDYSFLPLQFHICVLPEKYINLKPSSQILSTHNL